MALCIGPEADEANDECSGLQGCEFDLAIAAMKRRGGSGKRLLVVHARLV